MSEQIKDKYANAVREVGGLVHSFGGLPYSNTVFSYEFRSDEQLDKFIANLVKEAVLAEREACVDICRELYSNDGITCAEAIMERE